MLLSSSAALLAADRELIITRNLPAPRHLVFAAWSSAEHQVHWMGPKDFTVPSCEIDFRVGGAYRACIRSPEGQDYWMRGHYREIVTPEKLVFTFAWEEDGERGLENLVTIQFADLGDSTRMVFRQAPFQSSAERDSHHGGWSECFDRLAAYASRAATH
ncbi:SRPBCC family protein [Chitinolyticbacter meiyuanensis]|uniref:SRPBCC family protein n=1 Tax=Chitinolyticbacter meiyuanensis TaxID=682798 RepID=UPI0011E59A1A|nr:SRPBCC domain-containing protein [Chitinolyticbacter meiyuanensis]